MGALSKGKGKRATAAGMMDDDDAGQQKTLYKPEEGLEIEGGLEPDKPTASQLEAMRKLEEGGDDGAANGMDVDNQDGEDGKKPTLHEDDVKQEEADERALDDDEYADGGPGIKAAPISRAQREAEAEQRAAAAAAAAQQVKDEAMEVDQDDEDVDPLDAFMLDVEKEKRKVDTADIAKIQAVNGSSGKDAKGKGGVNGTKKQQQQQAANPEKGLIDMFEDESGSEDDEDGLPDMDDIGKTALRPEDILALAQKKLKKKDIAAVDHSKVQYEPFRKAFYHPPPEIEEMTQEEVESLRVELDNIKIRGVDCPKPITKWSHCGLPAVW